MSVYRQYKHLALHRGDDPPMDASEFERVETLLGAALPGPVRDFLQNTSGAELEYVFDIPVGAGAETATLSNVFSGRLDPERDGTFLYEIAFAREHDGVPPQVLPFARCGGDAILYLDLTPEGAGRVATFLGARPAWTGSPRGASFAVVANSFEDFLAGLRLDFDQIIDDLRTVAHDDHLAATIELLDIATPAWREAQPKLVDAIQRAQHRCATSESL